MDSSGGTWKTLGISVSGEEVGLRFDLKIKFGARPAGRALFCLVSTVVVRNALKRICEEEDGIRLPGHALPEGSTCISFESALECKTE